MNELQKVEFDLLKKFIEVCEKNNLKYYLIGGTCLGAVRHKGFIPWDDDIDVGMPRPDYDKFCKIAEKEFTNDIFFQSWKTDKNFPYNFSKLRNSNTTYIEGSFKFTNMNHGVWIDIFPIDGVCKKKPNFYMEWRVVASWVLMFFSAARCWTRVPRLDKHFLTDILLDILLFPMLLLNIGHWHNRVNERKMKRHKWSKCNYVANYQGCTIGHEIIEKNIFGDGTSLTFEGLTVNVPSDYDNYLKHIYGDYMKLPPVEKRVSKHNPNGESTSISYKDFHKNYKIWKKSDFKK
ncbi:MAG: LicD family protein [Bacilli bacterium]|nr:LicD family protein [Bacilli bacterium]